MEFLVHQGSILRRGRRLEGPFDKIQNVLGYLGETSEIMTREAIRDRVIRRRARQNDISFKEANKIKEITKEATFAARDYMDFGQGGGIVKAADNAMPYLSAAVQATRGLWRVAKENPITFSYKVAQLGAVTTLLYASMKENAPKTADELQGNVDMQNNFVIPLGDQFGFEDEKGQMRYPYFKIPIDPSQKFFKAFFESAYDKYKGNEVDVERLTNNMAELSPVGVSSMPPSMSAAIGYLYNKDLWLNRDVWTKTDKPFSYPKSKEEYIPGRTSEFFKDVGEVTGLSPERGQHAVEEITTRGTVWSYLMGKGYDALFADLPSGKKEQHLAMVLSQTPVVKRFIGVTNPYSRQAAGVEKDVEDVTLKKWIERRELDRLSDGYLLEGVVKRSEVVDYIYSQDNVNTKDRLKDRFLFDEKITEAKLPNRSWWLRLQNLDPVVRARQYHEESLKPQRAEDLARGEAIIRSTGGFFTKSFYRELSRLEEGNE